jgi:hypothetical protein
MKYTEYLQFIELLEQNNITLEEFKKNPLLYEGVLGKIGAGLWNLAKKGMKTAVSKGISSGYKEKLNAKAEEIKTWMIKEIETAQKDPEHPLFIFFKKRDELGGNQQKTPYGNTGKIRTLDKQITKYIHDSVNKQMKKIESTINKNKNIVDDDKEDLIDYWESLKIQIELSVAMVLEEKNITSDETTDMLSALLSKDTKIEQSSDTRKKINIKPATFPKSTL